MYCLAITNRRASSLLRWPRSMDQVPINVGDAGYDPLFKFGFGLSF